jgi:hypothetical protein
MAEGERRKRRASVSRLLPIYRDPNVTYWGTVRATSGAAPETLPVHITVP